MSQFDTENPGKPIGAKANKTKLMELLGKNHINDMLVVDFNSDKPGVRQFVYDHVYGKPAVVNKNENTNENIDRIEITLIPHEDKKQIAEVSKNQIVVKPTESQVSVKQIQREGNQ